MQHTQVYFRAVVLAILLAPGAWAGTIAKPARPDPLLDGGETSACAAGPVYAAGTDAHGNAVVPADVGAAPVPLPDQIAVPLAGAASPMGQTQRRVSQGRGAARGMINPATGAAGQGAYVMLDGRKLEPLVNPKALQIDGPPQVTGSPVLTSKPAGGALTTQGFASLAPCAPCLPP